MDTRISEALQSTFAELDKKEGEPVDTLPYMSFMVGNIMTGLCFGGRYTAFIIIYSIQSRLSEIHLSGYLVKL